MKSKTYVVRKKILTDAQLMKPAAEQRWADLYDLHDHRGHPELHVFLELQGLTLILKD